MNKPYLKKAGFNYRIKDKFIQQLPQTPLQFPGLC